MRWRNYLVKIGVYCPKMFRAYSMEYRGKWDPFCLFQNGDLVRLDSFQSGNPRRKADQGWIRHSVPENIWKIFTKRINNVGLVKPKKKKTSQTVCQTVCLGPMNFHKIRPIWVCLSTNALYIHNRYSWWSQHKFNVDISLPYQSICLTRDVVPCHAEWSNWGYMVYIYMFDLKPFCYHYFKRYHHLIFIDHVKRDFRCLKLNQFFWVVNPSSV